MGHFKAKNIFFYSLFNLNMVVFYSKHLLKRLRIHNLNNEQLLVSGINKFLTSSITWLFVIKNNKFVAILHSTRIFYLTRIFHSSRIFYQTRLFYSTAGGGPGSRRGGQYSGAAIPLIFWFGHSQGR